jgi:osmotically-inducible protein OsmY
MRTAKAFVLGASAAYLFDPVAGKRRRQMIVDRVARAVRKLARWGGKKVRYSEGKLQGLIAVTKRPLGSEPKPTDDAAVLQRIRSEAFREAGVSTGDVDVEVRDGVVTLSGTVDEPEVADDLVERISKVSGVRDVTSMLRARSDQAA